MNDITKKYSVIIPIETVQIKTSALDFQTYQGLIIPLFKYSIV